MTGTAFAGIAEEYHRYRVPYPEEVFDWIRREYGLDGRGRLLDAGCGTGYVCVPRSRWFEDVVAIDPEPDMLRVAEGVRQLVPLDRSGERRAHALPAHRARWRSCCRRELERGDWGGAVEGRAARHDRRLDGPGSGAAPQRGQVTGSASSPRPATRDAVRRAARGRCREASRGQPTR